MAAKLLRYGADAATAARIERMLSSRSLITVFQPIRRLPGGDIIGAEALTRFVSSPLRSPEFWFADADAVGRRAALELLALEAALSAAKALPGGLYVSVNLSPRTCTDPRLGGVLERGHIGLDRIVVEVTEDVAVDDYPLLAMCLGKLREAGLRIAVDDAGAGYASPRHVLELGPDIIKLDRSMITGIDTDRARRAFGAAMVGFAAATGAELIAEGIETVAELAAVVELGMDAGQGYLLGRPSLSYEEWPDWPIPAP
jgi:EAL domain-containing protein (putative c-di-GMP-specific phosphodiesterase class I)